mmetsp:Transcript_39411/g.98648  ORF Transcript_39411/g.98648 Transcript_39411/m.98648 type:complete len:204 (-) Transcript_39411:270-881(-)
MLRREPAQECLHTRAAHGLLSAAARPRLLLGLALANDILLRRLGPCLPVLLCERRSREGIPEQPGAAVRHHGPASPVFRCFDRVSRRPAVSAAVGRPQAADLHRGSIAGGVLLLLSADAHVEHPLPEDSISVLCVIAVRHRQWALRGSRLRHRSRLPALPRSRRPVPRYLEHRFLPWWHYWASARGHDAALLRAQHVPLVQRW